MQRRLILLRHAQSSPAEQGSSDHERPLSKKGLDDARVIGKRLKKFGYIPERVLCSDARRTRETWAQAAGAIGNVNYAECPALYESSAQAYFDVMSSDEFSGTTLLLVGHNPTIESVATKLCGQKFEVHPGDAVIIETYAPNWGNALESRSWKLVEFLKC